MDNVISLKEMIEELRAEPGFERLYQLELETTTDDD
jgi:hypothetical protein